MRHSVSSMGAGDVAPGMATFSSALLASPSASQSLPAGNYIVTTDSPLRGTPKVDPNVPPVMIVPAGTSAIVFGTVSNYFADAMVPGPSTFGVRGWLSVANLTLAPATQAGGQGNQVPGAPPAGAPPALSPATPGPNAPPAVTSPGATPSTSGIPTWIFPAAAAALLGWFFLVEQKKGRRRR